MMYIIFQGGITILASSNLVAQNKFNGIKYKTLYLVTEAVAEKA